MNLLNVDLRDLREASQVIPVNELRSSWLATDPQVTEAVSRVLRSGRYVHGPEHEKFEIELAGYVGVGHAVGVASGTDGLTLALQALGCGPGSEVIAVANAGGYAAAACTQLGCGIVYADVDPVSLLMSADSLAEVLRPWTAAVVVTHLFGNVADVPALTRLCEPLGVPVIEDCAQALGAGHDESRAGAVGAAAVTSFYPTKNLGGAGEGGAVLTSDAAVADRIRSLREYGWDRKYHSALRGGRNSRMDELQAAILRIGLSYLDELNDRRSEIARGYRRACDGNGLELVTGAVSPTNGHLTVVRTESAHEREALRQWLSSRGIGTDVHYPYLDVDQPGLPRPVRPELAGHRYLAQSRRAVSEILTVPCYPTLDGVDIARICVALEQFPRPDTAPS